jgi:GNAT superfamily N-acetyltransferase
VSVRRARAEDADDITAVLAELGYSASPPDVARRLAGLDANGRSAALVAVTGANIVGVLTLHMVPVLHEPGDWCRLTALVVAPAARRRGVATALVTAAEAIAREAGCVRIEVTSALHRDGAHEFYRGRGYGQVSEHFLKPLRTADG